MNENEPGRDTRPQFAHIDAWGLTDQGLVRKDNQDQFLRIGNPNAVFASAEE